MIEFPMCARSGFTSSSAATPAPRCFREFFEKDKFVFQHYRDALVDFGVVIFVTFVLRRVTCVF